MEPYKIKPEMMEKFNEYLVNNCKDPYSFAATKAALDAMAVLDVDGTCEEAHKEFYGHELTGFLAGCAAQVVTAFHVRGNEFRIFWNEQCGVTEEKAKGGIVNPAIMTFKGDESGAETNDGPNSSLS
jgi:hypothetical protein